jgi:hypothetical protein
MRLPGSRRCRRVAVLPDLLDDLVERPHGTGRQVLGDACRVAEVLEERAVEAVEDREVGFVVVPLPLARPRCGGEMRVIGFITEPALIDRIVDHLRRRDKLPRAPPLCATRWPAPPEIWPGAPGCCRDNAAVSVYRPCPAATEPAPRFTTQPAGGWPSRRPEEPPREAPPSAAALTPRPSRGVRKGNSYPLQVAVEEALRFLCRKPMARWVSARSRGNGQRTEVPGAIRAVVDEVN